MKNLILAIFLMIGMISVAQQTKVVGKNDRVPVMEWYMTEDTPDMQFMTGPTESIFDLANEILSTNNQDYSKPHLKKHGADVWEIALEDGSIAVFALYNKKDEATIGVMYVTLDTTAQTSTR